MSSKVFVKNILPWFEDFSRVGEVERGRVELTAVVSPAFPLRPSSNRTGGFPAPLGIMSSPHRLLLPCGRAAMPGLPSSRWFCLRALSPFTPESPAPAFGQGLGAGAGFTSSGRLATLFYV